MNELLVAVAKVLAQVTRPLRQALISSDHLRLLLERYGWAADLLDAGSMQTISGRLNLGELMDDIDRLAGQLAAGTADAMDTALALLEQFTALASAIRGLASLQRSDLPFPLDQEQLWLELPVLLVDDLLISYLEEEQGVLFGALLLLGLAEVELVEPDAGRNRTRYLRRRLRWDLIPELSDPTALIRKTYHWAQASGFDHGRLLRSLTRFLWAIDVQASLAAPPQVLLDAHYPATSPHRSAVRELRAPILREGADGDDDFVEAGLSLFPVPATSGAATPPTGLLLGAYLEGTATPDLGDGAPGLRVEISGRFESSTGFGVVIQPDGVRLEAAPGAGLIEAKAGVAGVRPRTQPWILLGTRTSHRIELYGLRAEVGLRGRLDDPELLLIFGTGPPPDPPKLAFVLQFANGDGFLNRIFGTEPQRLEFGGMLTWSSKSGLSLSGQATLTFTIPINQQIGFVKLTALTVGVSTTGKQLDLIVALSGGAALGPFQASIQRVGVKLTLKPAEGDDRRVFGDLALGFGFKPPDGAGLAIKAPGVTGGGFLAFDQARQEYAGVVQLGLAGFAVSAIALVTTRPGEFSLLVIISVQFSPIQLGYGFTLNGIGGLLGVNRTIAIDQIQAGLKQGSLDTFLFPRDPVRNAPQLIASLTRFFPSTQGQFVIGPSVVIGWGSPTILTITLGVLLELPSPVRVVLAGQLRLALPSGQPILLLQMDLLGSLDFAKGRLAIDATLRDSRVAAFALAGDIAIRASWGEEPGFLLAAGGFNPRFKPPARLPTLERLSLSLGTGDNPRVRLESYMALTSNTVQFGARLDLYASADLVLGRFSVSATIGFDALFQFDPFAFVIDLYATVLLKWNDDPFLGIELSCTLSGPTPWRAQGQATFHFLGRHTVTFELTVGEQPPPEPPELIDVFGLLRAAVQDPRNWEALRPPDGRTLVTLRAAPPSDDLVVHPLGSLTVRQRVVPLRRDITRFGAGRPRDATRFDLAEQAADGTRLAPDAIVEDQFARAQFVDLTEAERLAAPSFEPMPAGARFGGAGLRLPTAGIRDVDVLTYDEHVVDVDEPAPDGARPAPAPYVLDEAELRRLVGGGAAARNGAAAEGVPPLAGEPLGIAVRALRFQVAAVGELTAAPGMPAHDLTFGQAAELLRDRLADRPELAGLLQVVGAHEVHR